MIIKTTDQTGIKYLAWINLRDNSLMWVHNKSKAQSFDEVEGKKIHALITEMGVICSTE